MTFYERFHQQLVDDYGLSATSGSKGGFNPNLVGEHVVTLPRSVLQGVQRFIQLCFRLRNDSDYQTFITSHVPQMGGHKPKHFSALMAYDFHLDANLNPRLIEINTNASASLLVDAVYRTQAVENPFGDFRRGITATFLHESILSTGRSPTTVAIVDADYADQKMFFEFVLYKRLFEQTGWKTVIAAPEDLHLNERLLCNDLAIDLVYNRFTDFYLQEDRSGALRMAFEKNATCLTPHPFEYGLLADKTRQIDWGSDSVQDLLKTKWPEADRNWFNQCRLQTRSVRDWPSADALWNARQAYFFKPAQMFGGKAVYRGASVTRRVFAELYEKDTVAQEYVSAPTVTVHTNGKEETYKYDLRFYVYRDQIQLVSARLYQGQVTNFQHSGGGLCPVQFT